jgi:opacity protein-like surface antigen
MKKFLAGAVAIALFLTFSFSATLAQEANIYDKDWSVTARIRGGKIYGLDMNLEGYIKDGRIYDKNWMPKGYVEGNRIYDQNRNLQGYIKKGKTETAPEEGRGGGNKK